jgi:hypothetical protein
MAHSKRTPEQWQQLLAEQADSGLTIKAFCEQKQLTLSNFYLWRKKLSGSDTLPAADNWLSLPVTQPAPAAQWQMELRLPGGVVLRMHAAD